MTTSETSTDQKLKQTSLLEDFHASRSQSPVSEEEKMMIVTSGMKLLELLPKQNQNGLLAKMLRGLLTSTTAWYSDRCKLIWKKKVSKSNVLLFQLQASVHGIKEKEFGLLVTPTATQIPKRSKEAMEKRIAFRKSIGRKTVPFSSLEEQITTLYPTPTPACEEGGEQSNRVERTKKGSFILRKKNNPHMTYGAKLSDAMLYLEKEKKLYPTPSASDHKDISYNPVTCKRKLKQIKLAHQVLKNNKPGGKLNPNFVEFLMAYPTNWTKIEQTELKHSETQ